MGDLLYRRGFRDDAHTRRFLDPKLAHLSAPHAMAGRAEAIDRIVAAIRRRERIVVFGDYDCDGITAVAILAEIIELLGGQVVPLLANRFTGGYGLSDEALELVCARNPGLLITCDCGSTDHGRIARLAARGVDTVVIDHHLVPAEPLPAVAFLNPHRPDCPFEYKQMSSCGLVLSLAAGLRAAMHREIDLRQWLDLVAIGTVADVAPLDGDNRVLVRAGLRVLGTGQRVGVRALAQLARIDLRAGVSVETIAFGIAPRLNAPGRLTDPELSLQLLMCKQTDQAAALASQIEQARNQRRERQAQMMEEAVQEVEACGFDRDPGLVLGRQGWHPGVVGIVAAQLTQRYGKPTVVVAFDGATGRGSARAPAGVNVYELLQASREAPISFGGHAAAAGVHLESRALERLRELFNAACAKLPPTKPGAVQAEVVFDAQDSPREVLEGLQYLEPCGAGNPAPRLVLRSARVGRVAKVRGGHLQAQLLLDGREAIHGFGPNMGHLAEEITSGQRVHSLGMLRWDTFGGDKTLGFRIEALEPAGS